MRRLTSFLIGGAIVAWMAYLSWPVTADVPRARQESVETAPNVKRALQHSDAETFPVFESKAPPQPSV